MAGAVSLEVQGIRELSRTLRACGVGLEDLKRANAEVSRIVARGAAARSPKDSGALAGSIRGSRQANAAVVKAGGARAVYAGVQNYGWPRRNIRASHFMDEGAEGTRSTWMEQYEREVDRLVAQVHGV